MDIAASSPLFHKIVRTFTFPFIPFNQSATLLSMNKLNIPETHDHQKPLNVVEVDIEHNPQETPCLLCGKEDYEWGHNEGFLLEHYKEGNPTGILAGKDYIRVRRCLSCNNLQMFHVHASSS